MKTNKPLHNLCLATIGFLGMLTSGFSTTITINNPGEDKDIQPLLQEAANAAVDGDLIVLPEGHFILNKNVVINKFVSIKGAGINNTFLYRAENVSDDILSNVWAYMFLFDINRDIPSNIIVSDLSMKSKKPSVYTGDGLSLASDGGVKMINCVDFIITRCRFENFGNAAVAIYHKDDLASGLIFKNTFSHNVKGPIGLGLGYGVAIYGANLQWISNPKFGSSNFIFIEDNTFDYHRHSIAAGGCGLYVARYNTITNNIVGSSVSTHAIDTHSARGGKLGTSNYFGTRAIEAYNNTVINTTFKNGTAIKNGQSADSLVERAILIRAGEALVYNNTIKGYRFGVAISLSDIPWGTAYPLRYATGYLSGVAYGASHTGTDAAHASGDLFTWNNSFTPYIDPDNSSTDFYNYTQAYFKMDRDYHFIAKPQYLQYTYPHPMTANAQEKKDTCAAVYNANLVTNRIVSGDFDGDGSVDDIAAMYDNGNNSVKIDVWLNQKSTNAVSTNNLGEKSFQYKTWWSSSSFNAIKAGGRFVSGDFNGDGKTDLATLYDYDNSCKLWVWLSNGTGFSSVSNWWSSGINTFVANNVSSRFVSGDFNGDGKADIAAMYDYGNSNAKIHVWISNGTTFEWPQIRWKSDTNPYDASKVANRFVSGDFNGDNMDDIAAMYDDGNLNASIHVWQSDAVNLLPTNSVYTYWTTNGRNSFGANNVTNRLICGDFNNDGKDDLAAMYKYSNNNAKLFLWSSNGSSFNSPAAKWAATPNTYNADKVFGRLLCGDYNNDGKDDVYAMYDYSTSINSDAARSHIWETDLQNNFVIQNDIFGFNWIDANGINRMNCNATSSKRESNIDDVVSVEDFVENTDEMFNIYPNPASTSISINSLQSGDLSLYDMEGRVVLKQQITEQITSFDISQLSNGVYFIKLLNNVSKFIKI